MKKIIANCLFCLFFISVQAQNAELDIKQVQENYQKLQGLHCQIQAVYYDQDEKQKKINETTTTVFLSGKKAVFDSDELRYMLNDKYLLVQHKKQQVLSVAKIDVPKVQEMMIPKVAEALAGMDEVIYKGEHSGKKCYVLKQENALVELIEIYIDTKMFMMDRIVYHYNEDYESGISKQELKFNYLDVGTPLSNRHFSEKEYIIINENVVQLNKKMKAYTLVLGDGLEYHSKHQKG